jgi:predicted phage baseplate assembly protein
MCLPSTEREGEVKVVIIPKFDELGSDYREKLLPSTELLRQVRNYLDERRLVTTLVNVARPRYVDITVRVDVIRAPTGSADKVKREIEKALRVFLHPLRGGRNGKGWAFGRNVLKMDLYHVIEEVAGVERVDKIQIVDEDQRHIAVDQIKIGLDALPYLVEVEVTEKSREKLL